MTKVKDKIQAPDLVEQNEAVVYAGDVHPDTEIPASMVHPDPVKMPPLAQPIATSQADRLIELAIQNNADVDRLDKLLELKERYEKEEARKSYTAAMAAFKGEDIVITKDRTVRFPHKDGPGETSYKHASLGNIISIAVPRMAAHGLSHKWESKREGDRIEVRCVVTHRDGHSESTEWWPGPLDASGKKNPIQQAASTVTYLERYTFLMITGLAVEEQDDDGAHGADDTKPELITEDQALSIHAKITDNDLDMDIFMGWLKRSQKCDSIEAIPVALFDFVMNKIEKSIKDKS